MALLRLLSATSVRRSVRLAAVRRKDTSSILAAVWNLPRHIATMAAAAAAPLLGEATFRRVQTGLAQLVAVGSPSATHLTTIAHQAPARLIPMPASKVQQASAAVVYLGNYGGGLLGGDSLYYRVRASAGAKLALVTQGSNRIFRQASAATTDPASTRLHLQVDDTSTLVVAGDPVTVFDDSLYEQTTDIDLSSNAHLALVDWVAAGRLSRGERWQQRQLTTSWTLRMDSQTIVHDKVRLTSSSSVGEWTHDEWNAYASLLLYGDNMTEVVERCWQWQSQLVQPLTRVRENSGKPRPVPLAAPVVLGLTEVPTPNGRSAFVARVAATSNEDLFRVFADCLAPLQEQIGIAPYRDRIHAGASAAAAPNTPASVLPRRPFESEQVEDETERFTSSSSAYWSALLLADSALPVGSFAHSAGLEAAAQLGWMRDVEGFIAEATQSAMQLSTALVVDAHQWALTGNGGNWKELDHVAHSILVSNGPACRASLDQGRSLLRVARQWKSTEQLDTLQHYIDQSPHSGHLSTVFGVVAAGVGLSAAQACTLLGYCTARDLVSAAVRLNLLGPMASVGVLSSAQQAARRGMEAGRDGPSSSAPVIDAIHPTHDVLVMRLFRT